MFYNDMLQSKKADSFREKLVVASYGVWQRHGGKKSWAQYKTALGLDDRESREVSQEDKKEAIKTALSIDEQLRLGRKKSGNKS